MTPTRELAIQVKEEIFNIGRFKRIKVNPIFGKSSFLHQEKQLKQKTHVIVATPGRLIDHIEKDTVDLSMIKYIVIDEADEMLKMGFVEQVDEILKVLPKSKTQVILSATLPEDIKNLCNASMKEPIQVEIEETSRSIDRISQFYVECNENQKIQNLKETVLIENPDSCIIFCNTQVRVDDVCDFLENLGCLSQKIHGGLEQKDRLTIMNKFKKGKFRYLVATDVAARGIDIDHIELVINFDLPNSCENYVHRIGRTGRIGNFGKSISLVSPSQKTSLIDIQEFLEKEIPLLEKPSLESLKKAEISFLEKNNQKLEEKKSKSEALNKNILKIHINAGKKTKMRPVDIVGTLCSIDGITAEDIGIINIWDISTFVEILNGKGEYVLDVLQTKNIKGRLRKVTKTCR